MNRLELSEHFRINMEKERMNLGLSQAQMAEALDLSLSAYKRILNGETTKIDFYTLYRMYELTHKLGYELCDISDDYVMTFEKIRKLSASQLRLINSIMDFELEFSSGLEKEKDVHDYITVLVPTGNMQDGMVYDASSFEKVNIAPYRKRYGDCIDCGIRITSNHLHPVYHLNDILLISHEPIRDGDTGVFIHKPSGLAYIRKFHHDSPCQLEPLNNYGKTFYVDSLDEEDMDHWIKFGRVITKMRT